MQSVYPYFLIASGQCGIVLYSVHYFHYVPLRTGSDSVMCLIHVLSLMLYKLFVCLLNFFTFFHTDLLVPYLLFPEQACSVSRPESQIWL